MQRRNRLQYITVVVMLFLCGLGRQASAKDRSLGPLAPEPRRVERVASLQGNASVPRTGGEELPALQLPRAPLPGNLGSAPAASETSLTLQDAIDMAVRCNPDLRAAEQRVQLADAILARARSDFYPRLGVSEDFGVTNNAAQAFMYLLEQGRFSPTLNFNNPGTVDDFHTQLLAQQGVYAGGRRMAETQAADANRHAARFALAAVQNELVFRVAEAYYRTFQARELVAVRQDAVRQVERHLEIVRARERAETAVKSDVLTVEVRLAEVQEAAITAHHQSDLAWAVLENVCGSRIQQRALPTELPPAPWSEQIREIEAAVAEGQSRRPEVGELSGRLRAASENIRAAQAGKYPTVDVMADYDVFTPDFARGNDSWFVGVVVKLTLFDGQRTRNDVRQAEARL